SLPAPGISRSITNFGMQWSFQHRAKEGCDDHRILRHPHCAVQRSGLRHSLVYELQASDNGVRREDRAGCQDGIGADPAVIADEGTELRHASPYSLASDADADLLLAQLVEMIRHDDARLDVHV